MRSRVIYYCSYYWILLLGTGLSYSQSQGGTPGLRMWTNQISGGAISYAITQSTHGLIYLASDSGLYEFDGRNSERVAAALPVPIRCLYTDAAGNLWLGTSSGAGRLKPDSSGNLAYIPSSEIDQSIEDIISSDKSTYLIGKNNVWQSNAGQEKAIRCKLHQHTTFVSVQATAKKLIIFRNQLAGINNDEIFPMKPPGVTEILTKAVALNDTVAILANNQSLFRYDGQQVMRWPNRAAAYLEKHTITDLICLADNRLAVGTQTGGVLILNQAGDIETLLSLENGLIDNQVIGLYVDAQAYLWVLLSKGVARIAVSSPLTRFAQHPGLRGEVNDIIRFGESLYVATSCGIFLLEPDSLYPKFSPVNGISGSAYNFVVYGARLLAATAGGLMSIRGKQAFVLWKYPVNYILASGRHLLVGLWNGAGFLVPNYQQGGYYLNRIQGMRAGVYSISIDANRRTWFTTDRGLIGADFHFQGDTAPKLVSVNIPGHRLGVRLVRIRGQLRFLTDAGIFKWQNAKSSFVPDSSFLPEAMPLTGLQLCSPENNLVFAFSAQKSYVGHWDSSRQHFQWQDLYTGDFGQRQPNQFQVSYADPKGSHWLGGINTLWKYHTLQSHATSNITNITPQTLIRRFSAIKDTIRHSLWSGYHLTASQNRIDTLALTSDYSHFRFEFTGAEFSDRYIPEFQYKLEGYDQDWSPWSNTRFVEYRQLPIGTYHFRVRTRNQQCIGNEAHLQLMIVPFWYQTGWGKTAGISLLIILLIGIYQLGAYRQRLKYQLHNAALEAGIREAQQALRAQNRQLELYNQEITRQRAQIMADKEFIDRAHQQLRSYYSQLIQQQEALSNAQAKIKAQQAEIDAHQLRVYEHNKEMLRQKARIDLLDKEVTK